MGGRLGGGGITCCNTPDLSTKAVEVIESHASDHFTVIADLTSE